MKSIWFYDYPVGTIGITEENNAISRVFFTQKKKSDSYETAETSLIQKAAIQLREYFDGKRKNFDLPLFLQGTDFQETVWRALQTVAFGDTCSYKKIATLIGNPQAARAVGMANNRNPIVIIVPCHRVIGISGKLIGYAGGINIKQYLLNLEKTYA